MNKFNIFKCCPGWLSLAFSTVFLLSSAVFAQGMMKDGMSCPMCGAMGWGGMILGAVLMIAVIAVLFSLALYLFRRSRTGPPSDARS